MDFFFFLPCYFFSVCLLFQLVYNSKIINSKKYNFPILGKEGYYQTVLILGLMVIVILNSEVIGLATYSIFKFNLSSKYLQVLLNVVSLLILPSIILSMQIQKLNFVEFFSILLISLLSMCFLINCTSLLTVFLCVELQTICFYILTAYNKSSGFSSEAGLKYFLISAIFSGIFLFGVNLVYFCLGTVNFEDIANIMIFKLNNYNNTFNFVYFCGFSLIIFWLLFKLTCFPFHFWAPDVYEGAPLSSTIVFSIPAKIAVTYILIKWISIINAAFEDKKILFIILGLLSCVIGTMFALSQSRIKRLLIYSSIAQVGFICSSIFIGNFEAYVYSIVFLLIYVFTSIFIWNNVVLLYYFQEQVFISKYINSNIFYFSTLINLFKTNNGLSYSFILIIFSISGIPPLLGFFGKFLVFNGIIEFNEYLISILFIFVSSISVYYYIKILKMIFFEVNKLSALRINIKLLTSSNIFVYYIVFVNSTILLILFIGLFYPELIYIFSEVIVLYLI